MTETKQTEQLAIREGYQVKKNAIVMDGCKPVGILVRRPGEKVFTPLYFYGGKECLFTPAPVLN